MPELSIDVLDSIALRPRARAVPKLHAAFVRELGPGDEAALRQGKPPNEPQHIVLSEVKAKHHTMAMMLAAGAALARVSFVTGYGVGTIKRIQDSPLFQDLLAYYVEQKEHEFKDFYAKAAQVGMDAVELLHQRMMDKPDDIKTRELLDIAEKLLERTILPSKVQPNGGAAAPQPAPVTVIQFIDSPHSGAEVARPPAGGTIIEARPQAQIGRAG